MKQLCALCGTREHICIVFLRQSHALCLTFQPIYNACVLLCEMHASESRTVVMGTRLMLKQQLIVASVSGE